LLEQRHEVRGERQHRSGGATDLRGRDILTKEYGQLAGQVSEHLAVAGGDTEQLADHGDGELEGEVVDDVEVARVAQRRQQVLGCALQTRLGAYVEDRHVVRFAAKKPASSRPSSVVGCPVRSSLKMAVQSAVARNAPRIEYSPTKMRFVNTKSRGTVAWRITSLSMFAM